MTLGVECVLTWLCGVVCCQYDVGLVQAIEKLTGVTLEEYPLEEEEVLKGITKVSSSSFALPSHFFSFHPNRC